MPLKRCRIHLIAGARSNVMDVQLPAGTMSEMPSVHCAADETGGSIPLRDGQLWRRFKMPV